MTDKKIIEALECCENNKDDCGDCPKRIECFHNNMSFIGDGLDLIKRQQAEIERLKIKNEKVVNDFKDFAMNAFKKPFACRYCKYVERGGTCLWNKEHKYESCQGKHFVYEDKVGEENDL